MASAMPRAKAAPSTDQELLELLSLKIFIGGFTAKVVEDRWPAMREALHGFDPAEVAAMGAGDVERLLADPRIIRNREKLHAIVENARAIEALRERHGSFRAFLDSLGEEPYAKRARALRRLFARVGEHTAYHFLMEAGEEVPARAKGVRRVDRKRARHGWWANVRSGEGR